MRPNSRFDRFIVSLFRITLFLFQISLTFFICYADDPTKVSHTFPKGYPFSFVFSIIFVNTRVLVYRFLCSLLLFFLAVT